MLKKISLIGVLVLYSFVVYSAASVEEERGLTPPKNVVQGPEIVVEEGFALRQNEVHQISVHDPSAQLWDGHDVLEALAVQMGKTQDFKGHPLLVDTLEKFRGKKPLYFLSVTVHQAGDLSSMLDPSGDNRLIRVESYLDENDTIGTFASLLNNREALKSLLLLDLGGNLLQGNIGPIVKGISSTHLSSLALDYSLCKLEEENPSYPTESMQALEDALSGEETFPSLVHLGLSGNALGNRGAQMMGRILQDNRRLRHLSFGDNDVTHEGARSLAKGLADNSSLRSINFAYNAIGDGGAWSFVYHLSGNNSLMRVNFCMNGITGPCKEDLERAAGSFAPVTQFVMEENNGAEHLAVPENLVVAPLADRRRKSSSVAF
jgi:hypothetical protein